VPDAVSDPNTVPDAHALFEAVPAFEVETQCLPEFLSAALSLWPVHLGCNVIEF
jgi:hypothetical protein